MELRHLRYFVAVAEEMSLRRAAERLHIAAPPLSVQIRKLESEIGADLLARAGRGIKLTEAGQVFLEQARKTLANAQRGVELARQAANGEIGHLSIGYNAPTGFRVFPKVLSSFRKQWPSVHLTFHVHTISQQLEGLLHGTLDVGFVWLPIPHEEFDVHELVHEPLHAVLPAGHRLAKKQAVTIRELSGEPLVLLPRTHDPETVHQIEQLFRKADAVMNVAYELDNSLSMINFVAMGCGCSLMPEYTRAIRHDAVVYRPLRSPKLAKTLAIVKKKGQRGLADTFFRFTVDKLAEGFHARTSNKASHSNTPLKSKTMP
jgi:DNA-binding transcriptional LysR family regulator